VGGVKSKKKYAEHGLKKHGFWRRAWLRGENKGAHSERGIKAAPWLEKKRARARGELSACRPRAASSTKGPTNRCRASIEKSLTADADPITSPCTLHRAHESSPE
jgi:hypothetical protein